MSDLIGGPEDGARVDIPDYMQDWTVRGIGPTTLLAVPDGPLPIPKLYVHKYLRYGPNTFRYVGERWE